MEMLMNQSFAQIRLVKNDWAISYNQLIISRFHFTPSKKDKQTSPKEPRTIFRHFTRPFRMTEIMTIFAR